MSPGRRFVAGALAVTTIVAAFAACDRGAVSPPRAPTPEPAASTPEPAASTPEPAASTPHAVGAPPSGPRAPAPVLGAVHADAPVARAGHFVSLDVDDDAWQQRVRVAVPLRFKPVGTSSVVFKTTFVGGLEASFRPRTSTQANGWTNEVAAYRVARALDLDQVPPAVARAFSRAELQARLHPDYAADWPALDEKMLGHGDVVWGALVYWVPGLRDLELDTPRGMARWGQWLSRDSGALSPDEASLAADVGTMLCFDYLIANVDRWSGGNVRADASARRVVIRDHNLAFLAPLPRSQHERVLGPMRRVERFSRRFVIALQALDEPRLRAALAPDASLPEGTPLLDEAQLRGVLDRRAALLSRVAALLDAYGDAAVLAFP